MHIAASGGNLMVLRALLQNGGNAETEDREGESPLHKACKDCNFHIVRELLQFIRGFIGHTQVNIMLSTLVKDCFLLNLNVVCILVLHQPAEQEGRDCAALRLHDLER